MDLTIGSRLGPYEIVSRIGAGGMGEVFRARDTRLDRIVAIKVLPLDFGLAKSTGMALAFDASTALKPLTEEGTIVGTLQYMAPEQIEGREADPRTDLFALGLILYEMATGRRAFEGKTKTSLIAAIVASNPLPISSLRPLTPRALESLVERCLAKDPDDRWQCAADVKWALRRLREDSGATAATVAKDRRSRLAWSVAAAAVIAAVAAITFALR